MASEFRAGVPRSEACTAQIMGDESHSQSLSDRLLSESWLAVVSGVCDSCHSWLQSLAVSTEVGGPCLPRTWILIVALH